MQANCMKKRRRGRFSRRKRSVPPGAGLPGSSNSRQINVTFSARHVRQQYFGQVDDLALGAEIGALLNESLSVHPELPVSTFRVQRRSACAVKGATTERGGNA